MFSARQRIQIRLKLLIGCLSCTLFFIPSAQTDTSGTQHSAGHFSQAKKILPSTRIAIIIDDLGYNWEKGEQIAQLPGPVTVSILPHSPFGARLAALSHEQGKEVMLHAPMSNILDKPLDDGALTTDMGKQVFLQTLRANLESLPYVVGVNNHMGSLLTQHEQPMSWLMAELKRQHLYFIDSRTSPDSQAWEVAQKYLLPSSKRDFFLDHERGEIAVAKQFERFINTAKLHGHGIAIAHPYPETLALLAQEIPKLASQGVELISISELLGLDLKRLQNASDKRKNSALDAPTDYVDRIRTTVSHKK